MKKASSLNYLKQIVAFATLFALFSNVAFSATFTVNDGGDAGDAVPGDAFCATAGAVCTLRAAIEEANALAGTDTVNSQAGTTTIQPTTSQTVSSNIIIDSTATNKLVLNGDGTDSFSALILDAGSDGSQIRGMSIYGFAGVAGAGIEILSGADSVTIGGSTATGNLIGLLPDALTVGANKVGIISAGTNVTMNGNFVSGNNENGILINGGTGINIKNNTIGLDSVGADKGNARNGIYVTGEPLSFTGSGLQIGGAASLNEDNLISGNGWYGISIGSGVGDVSGTALIQGNYIGVDGSGVAKANDLGGINVAANASGLNLTVGTDGDGLNDDSTEGNVIGSNGGIGINIAEGGDVIIAGNNVGLYADGSARANTGVGIKVGAVGMGGPNTLRIGTDNIDGNEGNNIGSNTAGGVLVENATTIDINGNRIGMDSNGNARSNTGGAALKINAAQATTVNIGMAGTTAFNTDGSNYIGNSPAGYDGAVMISNTASGADVEIKANRFGLGTDDSTVATNATNGLYLVAPADYVIGTDLDTSNDSYERNYIANSGSEGIYVGNGPLTLVISGVTMGLARSGFDYTVTAPNGSTGDVGSRNGIKIASNSLTSFAFGGADAAQRNIVASSLGNGLFIGDVGAAIDFTIRNSIFGFASDLTTERDNTLSGISITDGGAISLIDNVVANSNADAVSLTGGVSYTIMGNKIGTGATGLVSHTNGGDGLVLNSASITSAVIGGATASLANVIASSTGDGIFIDNLAAANTPVTIQGNYIGVCADPTGKGTIATGNLADCDNSPSGIQIDIGNVTIGGGAGNTIETDGLLGTGNVISNNGLYGIGVGSSGVVTISGNIIGLIKSTIDDPYNVEANNDGGGIVANAGTPTLNIGGTGGVNASSNRNNIISGTTGAAVYITSLSNPVATIINNYINTDFTGATLVGAGNGGISVDGGSSVTIGGIGSNEGNLIQGPSSSAAVNLLSNFVGTLNLYKNIINLNAAGTAVLGSTQLGLSFEAAGATVNIGDGTAAGRNVIGGNSLYGIYISAATAVNVLGNYIGVASNGTTSLPNSTDSATLIGMGLPVVETYFTAISGALTVTGNVFNNSTHVAAYYLDETPTNESTMTADNTWYTKVNATVPTYNFWQRYSGATLAAFGPKACDDGYDNDSDGLIDYSADAGCSSASDTDEADPVAVVVSTPAGSLSTPSSTPRTTTTTTITITPTTTDTDTVPTTDVTEPVITQEERDFKDFVIESKLNEAVDVTSDALLGKDEIDIDLILEPQNDVAAPEVQPEEVKPLTPEQVVVVDALDKLAQGEDLTKDQVSKVEATVNQVLENSVQEVFKKAESSGGAVSTIRVSSSNGKSKTLTKDTKLKFILDSKKAADFQDLADAKGEDTLVVNPSTVIGDNNVSALLIVMQGGEIGDPLAAEKIFFKSIVGLASESDKLEELIPTKPKLTNFIAGVETAPKFLAWVAGPKAGEKVSVFAVDKVDPKNPKSWKVYKFGKHNLDEGYKAAVEIDLSEKMDKDIKNFTLVVQNEKGEGSSTDITLNKAVVMKLDTLTLINGDQVKPIDLTKNNDLLARSAKSLVHVAAIKVNSKDKSTDEKKTPEVITVKGYSEPGSVIFVTWKSVVTTSTVIADANGYFEVQVPKQLEKGDHTAYTSSYNKEKKTASNFAKIMFAKFF